MTDQPKPGKDGIPEGYGPPSFIPGREPSEPYGDQSYDAQSQPRYGQQPYGAPAQNGQTSGPFNAYGQPAYYGVPPEPKGLSIASMCCGIAAFVGLGVFILPQLAAVILGHLALRREPSGKGMAIAGLVLGYVAIALTILVSVIIAVAISLSTNSGSTRYGA